MSTQQIVGNMRGLTPDRLRLYTEAVTTFLRIQAYNQNIYTQRLAGNTQVSYYQYTGGTERAMFLMGYSLVCSNDPQNAANYALVPEI